MSNRRQIFFFGPLPPPTHGMAVVNAQMVELLAKYADVFVGDTSPHSLVRGFGYHFRKALRVLRIICQLPLARLRGTRIIYGSPDDSWGGLWTILILAMARILGMAVTLHHHSFLYLLEPTRIMSAITTLAGRNAHHVAIGARMGEKLQEFYPSVRNVGIFENNVATPHKRYVMPDKTIPTIGILSNLTVEKGALHFLEIFETALTRGLNCHAIMAGPVPDPIVRQAIDKALAKYPEKLTYLGPIYDDKKEQFFAEIDIFVFPTRYKTESFGLVLLESLVRGVQIVSFERGCNGQLRDLPGVTLIDEHDDIVEPTLTQLSRFSRTAAIGQAIGDAANKRNDANLRGLDRLAERIASGEE